MDDRLNTLARAWRVDVGFLQETETSVLAFGRRGAQPVVLKVLGNEGDEWRAGQILDAFDGRGVVRVYEYVDGAMLLERLNPGASLVETSLTGRDGEATGILAGVIARMSPRGSVDACSTVRDWARSFESYGRGADTRVPRDLVEKARELYLRLSATQSNPRLLHGDLHHANVLFDSRRGWLAIDPKGVIGELEFEIGAAMRNPHQHPELFAAPAVVERRLKQFAATLPINESRALAWAFAQAVLSAIWRIEDGLPSAALSPPLRLAEAIEPMLGARQSV